MGSPDFVALWGDHRASPASWSALRGIAPA